MITNFDVLLRKLLDIVKSEVCNTPIRFDKQTRRFVDSYISNEHFDNCITPYFDYLFNSIRDISDLRARKEAFRKASEMLDELRDNIVFIKWQITTNLGTEFTWRSFERNKSYFYDKAVDAAILVCLSDDDNAPFSSDNYIVNEAFEYSKDINEEELYKHIVARELAKYINNNELDKCVISYFINEIKARVKQERGDIFMSMHGYIMTVINIHERIYKELSYLDFVTDNFIDWGLLKATCEDVKICDVNTFIKKDKYKVRKYLNDNIPGKMAKPTAVIIFALCRLGYLDISNLSAIYRCLSNEISLPFTLQSLQNYISHKRAPRITPKNGTKEALFEAEIAEEQLNITATFSML